MILCTDLDGTNISVFITKVGMCFLDVYVIEGYMLCLHALRMMYISFNE